MTIKTIEWVEGKIKLIDQTKLPQEVTFLVLDDYRQVAAAIVGMRVRGAPAIGVAAAYGLALGAQQSKADNVEELLGEIRHISQVLSSTRPTAVNLFWALNRMKRVAQEGKDVAQIKATLLAEAQKIETEEREANRRMGQFGAELIQDGFRILTHCNAGALATVEYGTALGVVRAVHEQGKKIHVYAAETRPRLQGARLTAWELTQEHIPCTLITDTMPGYFLSKGEIDCVLVGADRIAANGDVANKIGTYNIAVLAMEHGVPFYVVAPTSTIDLSVASGEEIPIEERGPEEVTHIQGVRIAPEGVAVANPAFDITPHYFVSAIITEKGILREPYEARLRKAFSKEG